MLLVYSLGLCPIHGKLSLTFGLCSLLFSFLISQSLLLCNNTLAFLLSKSRGCCSFLLFTFSFLAVSLLLCLTCLICEKLRLELLFLLPGKILSISFLLSDTFIFLDLSNTLFLSFLRCSFSFCSLSFL